MKFYSRSGFGMGPGLGKGGMEWWWDFASEIATIFRLCDFCPTFPSLYSPSVCDIHEHILGQKHLTFSPFYCFTEVSHSTLQARAGRKERVDMTYKCNAVFWNDLSSYFKSATTLKEIVNCCKIHCMRHTAIKRVKHCAVMSQCTLLITFLYRITLALKSGVVLISGYSEVSVCGQ